MIIAVPTSDAKLCPHFGHCAEMQLFIIQDSKITEVRSETPPPHAPGVIPEWLSKLGATIIIAGGMGQKAIEIFHSYGVRVITGAPPLDPKEVVESYLAGTLRTGDNVCDH